MPVAKLKEFLDGHRIKYVILTHSPAITAQEIAASAHISGKQLAKTVMVKLDGKMTMAVLPASCRVDFDRLKEAAGARAIALASEDEFKQLFPQCECGAMPPFGNLYGMDVFVASQLSQDEEIAFNAGSHSELIKLAYKDFERLAQPRACDFAVAG